MNGLVRTAALVCICLLSACTATHPRRISRKQLNQLTKRGDHEVTKLGKAAGAAIRFTHGERSSESVLQEIPISSGDRFYAVLRAPALAPYLDHFDTEVRWMDPDYDKVTHIRLAGRPNAFAMYVGEIEIQVAQAAGPARTSPKQILSVKVSDDFDHAAQELQRLYPKFGGELVRSPALRSLQPLPSAPPRR